MKDAQSGKKAVNTTTETVEFDDLDDLRDSGEIPIVPKPKEKKRRWIQIAGLVLLVVAAVVGWRWWQFSRTHVSTENAQIQGHVSPISARIAATVKEIRVREGDRVEVGQTLAVLEDPDLALRIRQAEAKLAVAEAQLKVASDTIPVTVKTNDAKVSQSEAGLAATSSAVESAAANVNRAEAALKTVQAKADQARAELSRTEADFKRYETLYRQGDVSAQRYESARTAYESSKAGVTAAERAVDQSRAEVRDAQATLQRMRSESRVAAGQVSETRAAGSTVVVQQDQRTAALAQVEQARADLDLVKRQVQETVIASPVAGVVGQLTAQVGQKIEPAQALMAVVPLDADRIYVEANFKETVLGRLHPGQKADVEVDAFPGEVFHATVEGISPATGAQFALIPPDNATGNYNKVVQWVPVRLVFDRDTDPQHKLRPGLSLTVTVETAGAR